jgi:hypothetical protein
MSLRTVVIACLLALPAGFATAADKSVTLDTGQVFTINWGADWVLGSNPPNALPGTVTINGPDATKWRIAVGPLPPNPTLTADPGNLRMYLRIMTRGMENAGIQVDPEHKTIDGRAAHGLYVKAHDGHKKTAAEIRKAGGDFTDTYIGALSIGGQPYLFEVSWIAGGEAAANTALAAIKTIRIQ